MSSTYPSRCRVCGESYVSVIESGRYAESLPVPSEVAVQEVCVAREEGHTELYLHGEVSGI